MIYIGDSDTDIPCMKLVNSHGGYSIGVFNPEEGNEEKVKKRVYKMIRDNRIGYFTPADYSEGQELDQLIKLIIDRTVFNEQLERKHYEYKNEALKQSRQKSEEEQEKIDLIDALESSGNFKNTHNIIRKLSKYENWQDDEIIDLLSIGFHNSQVRYILGDQDIKVFYKKILEKAPSIDENAAKVAAIIEASEEE